MIIRRIEVCNFRKLVEPVVIENLPSGLAIVVGDNEEGKSTLLQAIRTGFFEKHNMSGERAASLQPYNSSVRPEIRLQFDLNGQRYKLFKAFCLKPEAELITPTGKHAGAAAEEELSQLLRFTPPQRTSKDASNHEHEGIFGMFWVEQGHSFRGINPTEDGRSSIQQALQQEVGDVLGGKRGQKIMKEVSRRRSELLTPTERPKGEYAKSIKDVQDLQTKLSGVDVALAEYERKLEDLERCYTRQKRYDNENTLLLAEGRLHVAQAVAGKLNVLRQTATEAKSVLKTALAEHDLAADRLGQRARLINEIAKTNNKMVELKGVWETNQSLLTEARKQMEREGETLNNAVRSLEQAQATLVTASANETLSRVQVDLNNLLSQERKVLKAKKDVEKAVEAATAIRIEKKDITRIKLHQAEVSKAQAELNALATNVRVDLKPRIAARIGAKTNSTGTEHRITETTVIGIDDCAKVTIIPGGDIGNPRNDLDKAQKKLNSELQQLGVANVADADARFEERQNLLNEIKNYRITIDANAPNGLDTFQETIAELHGEVQRLTKITGAKFNSLKEATSSLRATEKVCEKAEHEHRFADKKAKTANDEYAAVNSEEVRSKISYEFEANKLKESEQSLVFERKNVQDSELQANVLAKAQRVTTSEQTAIAASKELDDANPEGTELEVNTSKDALDQLRMEMQKLSIEIIKLESELRGSGAQGLGESRQLLEEELETAKKLAANIDRQAKTVELLHSVLVEAERAAKETFLQPVTRRLHPYLKLLLPEAELVVSEEMDIVGLRRGSVEEKFQSLSLGTREQLAVLTRLAFADLLREKGQPAVVLLDDAMVYADDDRFKRMLHILRKASEKIQIVILTCHERRYEGAGAPFFRLVPSTTSAGSNPSYA